MDNLENQENISVNISNKYGSTGDLKKGSTADLKMSTESLKPIKEVREGFIPYGEALLYDFKPKMFVKVEAEQRVL